MGYALIITSLLLSKIKLIKGPRRTSSRRNASIFKVVLLEVAHRPIPLFGNCFCDTVFTLAARMAALEVANAKVVIRMGFVFDAFSK